MIVNIKNAVMKKILLSVFAVLGLLSSLPVNGQTFTATDTVYFTTSVGGTYYNNLTNVSAQPINIRWIITNTNFPQSWLDNLGICDASLCRTNDVGTNSLVTNGPYLTMGTPYPVGLPGIFDVVLGQGLDTAASGGYFLTVNIKDATNVGGYGKNVTYMFQKFPTQVSEINRAVDEVSLYPNPARDELNVLFSPDADVKIISVYNLIGKVVSVYKLSSNAGAKLDTGNIPTGVYFIRLINGHGDVVATRKFTHQ